MLAKFVTIVLVEEEVPADEDDLVSSVLLLSGSIDDIQRSSVDLLINYSYLSIMKIDFLLSFVFDSLLSRLIIFIEL